MNYLQFVFLAIFLLFNSFSVSSQTLGSSDEKWEVWENSIEVSAELRVGVVDGETIEKINPRIIYVNLPVKPTSDLCIEVSSKDGRYKATKSFNKSNLVKGVNVIPWPTEYALKLLDFSSDEVTIMSKISSSCVDDPEYLVASSWSENFSSEFITVYLRSNLPPVIEISDEEGEFIKEIQCTKIYKKPTVTYDCECAIPKVDLGNNEQLAIIKRTTKRGRTRFKRYNLSIKL